MPSKTLRAAVVELTGRAASVYGNVLCPSRGPVAPPTAPGKPNRG